MRKEDLKTQIRKKLGEFPGTTVQQLLAITDGANYASTHRALAEMLTSGEVTRKKLGRTHVYSMATQPEPGISA